MPVSDWYISCMSEEESGQEVVLIGLGGAGIRTMLALRALIENKDLSVDEGRENSCRLLAIDSNYHHSEYFLHADEEDLEGFHLSNSEFFSLIRNGENPWDGVTKDAKSNIPEAVDLLAKRRTIAINRATVRSDYEAMIYVSRERMKQEIRDFLKNSEESKKHSVRPLKLIIATSLFGDTGSLSYLALLEILTELSEEIRCESINAVLFGPDVFEGLFPPQNIHTAKYLSVVNLISNFCFKEGPERIGPNQHLVSLNLETSVHSFPKFAIFTDTAKKLHKLIRKESDPENRVQIDGGDSMIKMMPLNLEKCLEIKNLFADRLRADRNFSDLVGEYSK